MRLRKVCLCEMCSFGNKQSVIFFIVLDFFLFELTDVSHLEDAAAAATVDDDNDDDSAVCKLFDDV